MEWYHWALVAGAVFALWASWGLPRAKIWIAAGAGCFVVTSMWHDARLPHGEVLGAVLNAGIVVMLYTKAVRRWEMRLWNCFQLMILLDALYYFGFVPSHYVFAVSLEVANWLALAVISGAGMAEKARKNGMYPGRNFSNLLDPVFRALHAKRQDPPFWHH